MKKIEIIIPMEENLFRRLWRGNVVDKFMEESLSRMISEAPFLKHLTHIEVRITDGGSEHDRS